MKFNLHVVFVLCASLLLYRCSTGMSASKKYFVSLAGDDQQPGTEEKPFKTIAKINTMRPNPGDQILFKGGEVFEGTLSLTLNGEADKPVIISSYGEQAAIIDGGTHEAIIIRGSNFHLRSIRAKGAGRKNGNTTNGIHLDGASNAVVEQMDTGGFQKSGLEISSGKNIEVRNVKAHDNGFCGILVSGSMTKRSKNILIRDCSAENNPGDPTALDNHSGNGILVGMSDSVTIDHCSATNNGWDMPRIGNGPVGIWTYESDHVTIQYCISYRNRTSKGGKDGGGFDLDGGVKNSVIQYCLSYENEGAGYGLFQYSGASLWYNNIVRYCVSIDDGAITEGSGGIFVWNGSDDSVQLADCLVHNNLIHSSRSVPLRFEPKSLNKNFNFYNNIFIGAGQLIEGPSSGERFAGNVWWSRSKQPDFLGYKSLQQWQAGRTDGQLADQLTDPLLPGPFNTKVTDPNQLNDLTACKLQPDSKLKNSGAALPHPWKLPVQDFFGTLIPKGGVIEPGIAEIGE